MRGVPLHFPVCLLTEQPPVLHVSATRKTLAKQGFFARLGTDYTFTANKQHTPTRFTLEALKHGND